MPNIWIHKLTSKSLILPKILYHFFTSSPLKDIFEMSSLENITCACNIMMDSHFQKKALHYFRPFH